MEGNKGEQTLSAILSSLCESLLALNRGTRSHLAATSTAQPGVATACTPQRNSNPGKFTHPQMPVGEVLTSTVSVSRRKRRLTDSRASCGHSWNQSMAAQLMMAGNLLLRMRSLLPTGEKHNATCRVQGRRRWEGMAGSRHQL